VDQATCYVKKSTIPQREDFQQHLANVRANVSNQVPKKLSEFFFPSPKSVEWATL